MVLYRKFRPDTFAAVKEQNVITDILRSAIVHNNVAHAYMFTGTRGTGKTTTARIFAKAVNCLDPKDGEPCNVCDSCISFNNGSNVDLVEIDAASNRGIDDIREIREKINFSPTMSTYKVYIIDEVHMLTRDAFNALLKTLEEPPSFVLFILATTEIYKVPLTIISRCQRFDFKNASTDEITKLLKEVAKKEKIKLEDDVFALVADLAEGSFRDSLSIFEKLISITKDITYEKALAILGIPDTKVLEGLIGYMLSGNFEKALISFKDGISKGIDPYQFNKNMLRFLEQRLISLARGEKKPGMEAGDILTCIREFLKAEEQLKYAAVPSLVLESAIISVCKSYREVTIRKEVTPVKQREVEKVVVVEKPDKKLVAKEATLTVETVVEPVSEEVDTMDVGDITLEKIEAAWPEIITKVMPFNHHLGSFLSKAKPVGVNGRYLVMEVKYSFHKDRIEEVKSREAIARVFTEVLGVKLLPKCEVNAKLQIKTRPQVKFEKKLEISDNGEEKTLASTGSDEPDILKEAMKIFEME